MKFYKKIAFLFIVLILIFLIGKKIILENKSTKWLVDQIYYKYDPAKKLTIAPGVVGTLINDASWLNQTQVSEIYRPTSVKEIQDLIIKARKENKKISLSGMRHSMGGQAFLTNAIQLDMTNMDSIKFNEDNTITTGPGATWKQIQEVLDKYNKAVLVMQDSNIFTIGGSVSVNAHGKDPRFKTLISTINYIKIINSEAKEVTISRTQNPELFKAVVGGYGMFGIITEVNLSTTENSIYKFSLQNVPTSNLLNEFENKLSEKDIELIEAHLSIDKSNFLTDSLIYLYRKTDQGQRRNSDTTGESAIVLRKLILDYSKKNDFGKLARWEMEKYLTNLEPQLVSRNTVMSAPVRFLGHTDPNATDVLQEYFVPKDRFYEFLDYYKNHVKKYNLDLVNVTLRKVSKDTEAAVSYAKEDMYAFVVYYSVKKDSQEIQNLEISTKELIKYLNKINATYYLCYGAYFEKSNLIAMYPEINNMFILKLKYDPKEIFSSNWYVKLKSIM